MYFVFLGRERHSLNLQFREAPAIVFERSHLPGEIRIGPHPETQAVNLVVQELPQISEQQYGNRLHVNVPYPVGRQKCDLCIGSPTSWEWTIEFKMLRLMGDNGKSNDNMLMHILSPYPNDRSALTDCVKLANQSQIY